MTNLKQFCPRGHDTFVGGRDSSYRCLACKREAMWAASRAREAEEEAIRRAERALVRAAEEEARKAERARIIKAGGPAAKELRWNEAFSRTLEETESTVSLCQWALPNGRPGACFQKTDEDGDTVYCDKHNRELAQGAAR